MKMVKQDQSRKTKDVVKSEASVSKINTRGSSGATMKYVNSTHKNSEGVRSVH